MGNENLIGVIVSVSGEECNVGMYEMSNDSNFLIDGELLNGPKVGAYLTIRQDTVKIIAIVTDEQIMDQKNSINSKEFDNRYSNNSINRVLKLKVVGVIEKGKFSITSQYVPMIGNELTLTTKEENIIIYGADTNTPCIPIGKSIREGQNIKLPINRFFASHIGIFGNTGSGKSNTLHKLYFELFCSEYLDGIKNHSRFFVIDFNGEYVGNGIFGLCNDDKKIYKLDTRRKGNVDRVPIQSSYLFDPDILSILFDARPATQVPFLRNALKKFNSFRFDNNKNIGKFIVGILTKILTTGNTVNSESLQAWIDCYGKYCDTLTSDELKKLSHNTNTGSFYFQESGASKKEYIGESVTLSDELMKQFKILDLINNLQIKYGELADENPLKQLQMFLDFQLIYKTAWHSEDSKYIQPLFNRIESNFNSLNKVITVKESLNGADYKMMNIISLVNCNSEVKRVVPMMLSKMIYDIQKESTDGVSINRTTHLIIDEAHNILNSSASNIGDNWRDYRLSVFEEIIKEGRKFGFFLTLASQRPADISTTILSQLHNYFIHRMVNDRDLQSILNTMPTIDRTSFNQIPSLGKGEAIVSGTAIPVPIALTVDFEKQIRPNSDDVILTEVWKE
ncbi:ATP-binding protein [Companilactobacillus mishanensis]|uniref:ATP-binding protein n=1 Tax=Companilactobacillus mishanensis TaxID=2486008 RepID=A0A5P0ZJ79_9LACO|nr:ATP-binding protein [Companilactobacillus mishanensis]MQS53134.1 ATP-binding protein [Companilactobacillus mishanensis]